MRREDEEDTVGVCAEDRPEGTSREAAWEDTNLDVSLWFALQLVRDNIFELLLLSSYVHAEVCEEDTSQHTHSVLITFHGILRCRVLEDLMAHTHHHHHHYQHIMSDTIQSIVSVPFDPSPSLLT